MNSLGFERFSAIGWSDGGISALILAARYNPFLAKTNFILVLHPEYKQIISLCSVVATTIAYPIVSLMIV